SISRDDGFDMRKINPSVDYSGIFEKTLLTQKEFNTISNSKGAKQIDSRYFSGDLSKDELQAVKRYSLADLQRKQVYFSLESDKGLTLKYASTEQPVYDPPRWGSEHMFVIKGGRMFVSNLDVGKEHHSSFFGSEVDLAGTFSTTEKGALTTITRMTGHFKTTESEMMGLFKEIVENNDKDPEILNSFRYDPFKFESGMGTINSPAKMAYDSQANGPEKLFINQIRALENAGKKVDDFHNYKPYTFVKLLLDPTPTKALQVFTEYFNGKYPGNEDSLASNFEKKEKLSKKYFSEIKDSLNHLKSELRNDRPIFLAPDDETLKQAIEIIRVLDKENPKLSEPTNTVKASSQSGQYGEGMYGLENGQQTFLIPQKSETDQAVNFDALSRQSEIRPNNQFSQPKLGSLQESSIQPQDLTSKQKLEALSKLNDHDLNWENSGNRYVLSEDGAVNGEDFKKGSELELVYNRMVPNQSQSRPEIMAPNLQFSFFPQEDVNIVDFQLPVNALSQELEGLMESTKSECERISDKLSQTAYASIVPKMEAIYRAVSVLHGCIYNTLPKGLLIKLEVKDSLHISFPRTPKNGESTVIVKSVFEAEKAMEDYGERLLQESPDNALIKGLLNKNGDNKIGLRISVLEKEEIEIN
ncbi:MAG: hypothetical protein ACI9BD_001472, partial [Candidatus Marinamargulisbacteria bacterium]